MPLPVHMDLSYVPPAPPFHPNPSANTEKITTATESTSASGQLSHFPQVKQTVLVITNEWSVCT